MQRSDKLLSIMVTKVLIDLDGTRDSVIRISNIREWASEDDVKDKLVKMFVESLSDCRPAILNYLPGGNDAILRPASLESILFWLRDQFSMNDGNRQLVQDIIDNEFGSVKAS